MREYTGIDNSTKGGKSSIALYINEYSIKNIQEK